VKRILATWVALAAASACRVAPRYEAPKTPMPAGWTEHSAPSLALEGRWWNAFQDPVLDGLIERARATNLDVRIAIARVREARALRDFAVGSREPELAASAGYTRSAPSENLPQSAFTRGEADDVWQAGFDASWELDMFGRLGHAIDAARAGLEAAEEARRDAFVTLAAEVGRNYVELRGLQRQIALVRSNLALQRDTFELTRSLATAGLGNELDVARAEAQMASTDARIPALEADVRGAIHRLSVLLALNPGELSSELEPVAPIPSAPSELGVGMPSELLRRRPDIRRAERELARSAALTAEATAELFPRFVIGGSIGQQSDDFKHLFDASSTAWSLGGSLTAPIFNGGRLRANVRAADARQEQALLLYEQTVLEALREVEDALANVQRERERSVTLDAALQANRRAVELATDLQARGLTTFFEVLDAQRELLAADTDLAASSTTLSLQSVALYKALGGGAE
jgi:outer membrane protein, multidrug efflux system